jgi:hypothetical protein
MEDLTTISRRLWNDLTIPTAPFSLVISYDCVVNTQLVMHCMVTKSFLGVDYVLGLAEVDDAIVYARTPNSKSS